MSAKAKEEQKEVKKALKTSGFHIGVRGIGAAALGVSLAGFLGVLLSVYAGDSSASMEYRAAAPDFVYPESEDDLRVVTARLLAEDGAALPDIAPASGANIDELPASGANTDTEKSTD